MRVISPHRRTAVILFNLGGPDGPDAVQPFLFNLFNDPSIISAPNPIRYFLAKLISSRRAPVAKEIYEKIGGKSPIVELTQLQANALEKKLRLEGEIKIFVCMRYWHPGAEEVAKAVKEYAPDHIIQLPLYPQFSTATSGSSFIEWNDISKKIGLSAPQTKLCCYPTEHSFIRGHAQMILPFYEKAKISGAPRLLFSAHGLPEKIINKGDPYQWQVGQTVKKIVEELAIDNLDWVTCYQSRVGPLKWIGPSTEDEIKRGGTDKIPLVVIPVAFVSEHSETLVELDMEYKHLAESAGVPLYLRVPALGTQELFIDSLSQLCLSVNMKETIKSQSGGSICPEQFTQCPHRSKKIA